MNLQYAIYVRRGIWWALLFCLPVVCGCDSQATVEGVVSWNDVPLPSAHVTFLPTNNNPEQQTLTTTDAEGRYQLTAPAGSYRVVISKQDLMPDPNPQPGLLPDDRLIEVLPARYSDRSQTELKAEVPAGGSAQINFPLVAQPAD